jgi:hypothetical protein
MAMDAGHQPCRDVATRPGSWETQAQKTDLRANHLGCIHGGQLLRKRSAIGSCRQPTFDPTRFRVPAIIFRAHRTRRNQKLPQEGYIVSCANKLSENVVD